MEPQELAQEMLQYLNEFGQYISFLDWMENRGFSKEELEKDLDNLENL